MCARFGRPVACKLWASGRALAAGTGEGRPRSWKFPGERLAPGFQSRQRLGLGDAPLGGCTPPRIYSPDFLMVCSDMISW